MKKAYSTNKSLPNVTKVIDLVIYTVTFILTTVFSYFFATCGIVLHNKELINANSSEIKKNYGINPYL